MVKSLVEMHGGSVRARSEGAGRGTEFVITLPLATRAGPGRRAGVTGKIRPREVLVIEDNADTAQTLADFLALDGHRVRIASDGRSRLALSRERRPEVILCDVGLPDMDGYEVARSVRQDPAMEGVRLVALTGYAQPEDRRRAAEAGFDAHIAEHCARTRNSRDQAALPHHCRHNRGLLSLDELRAAGQGHTVTVRHRADTWTVRHPDL